MKSKEGGGGRAPELESISDRFNVILDFAGFGRKTGRYTRFAQYSGLTNATSKRWLEESLVPRKSNRDRILDKLIIDLEECNGWLFSSESLEDWWIKGEGDPLHVKSIVSGFDHRNAKKLYELIEQIGDSESVEVKELPSDIYNLVCQTAFSWSGATAEKMETRKFKNLIISMFRLVKREESNKD